MAATDATLTAKTSPLERPTLGCMNLPCWEDTYVMNEFCTGSLSGCELDCLLSDCVCEAWEVQELAVMMSWCMT